MKLVLSIIALVTLTPGVLAQATAQPSPTANPETLDWCKAEPAYDAMLRDAEWKNANALYQILIAIKQRVTPEQRANMRTILLAMADGPRKPDPDLLSAVSDDLAEGATLRKLTTKQKAGLAINMQFAMHEVNGDSISNAVTSGGFFASTFIQAGMNTQRARKIADDVSALVSKARAN